MKTNETRVCEESEAAAQKRVVDVHKQIITICVFVPNRLHVTENENEEHNKR